MILQKKSLRYWWWLVIEFFKKHLKIILISFFVSFIFLIAITSFSPYLQTLLPQKKEIIGMVGNYDFNNLPEEITTKISNGLIYINEKGDIIPLLANSWEVKSKGHDYRFHLKNNLIWNDGKQFEAADINYQFKDISYKVIDKNTIDFHLEKPLGIFPIYLTKPLIRYPLIGIAGPYRTGRIKTHNGNITSLILLPNKKNLSTIIYKFFPNENQMSIAYKKGEITKMRVTKKSVADIFSRWKNSQITKTIDYSNVLTLFFNLKKPLLMKKEIRRAIKMAIDFNKFTNSGLIAKGPIPPISWAYNPNLKEPVLNQEMAEKIIKREISASVEAKLNLFTYYDYYDIADELVEDFNKIGLKVELNLISFEKPENFDFLLAFWKIPKDPDQYYFWHSTQEQGNISNYKNVKVDKLLEDGRSNLLKEKRKEFYLDFQKTMQDDPPAIFLYYPTIYTIERK